MWQYQNTNELYHTGVLGMKWGHRKAKIEAKNYARARKTISKNKGDKVKAIKSVRRKSLAKRTALGVVGYSVSSSAALAGFSLATQAAIGAAVAPAMPLVLGGVAAASLTKVGQSYMKSRMKKQENYIINS